ncbi:MAG: hypothetical protein EON89_15085, partial [Brevundimonas sp.]
MLIEMLAAMAVVSGGAAPAQELQARAAPRGDYRESCSGEYVNRGRLYADCRTRRGDVRGTSIELNRCADYEIRNNDGLLVCGPNRGDYEDRPGGGNGGGRPGGGWGGGGRGSAIVIATPISVAQPSGSGHRPAGRRCCGFHSRRSG